MRWGGAWVNRQVELHELTNFPVTVAAYDGEVLTFKIEFNRSRFDESAVRRMSGHLRRLLEGLAVNPEAAVHDLPLITDFECQELLRSFNASDDLSLDIETTVQGLFEAQVERRPDAVAIAFDDRFLTYRELNGRANQLAHRLEKLGVGPGVFVGLFLERSLEMVVSLLAVLKSGGAYVPIDPEYPPDRVAFMVQDAAVPVLLVQGRLAAHLPSCDGIVVVCHPSLNPTHRILLDTHARNLELDIVEGADPTDAACVIVQNPSFLGTVNDFTALAEKCHAAGALLVVSFYPLSLGLLKTPGEMGADIAVAEGQSLGIPLGFGGPYLGVMATRKEFVRKMPGRIAAQTEDHDGRRGFVLTLQAREQHIRREKAMSNICSNEALCALRALIYMSLLGKQGLRDAAVQCHSKAEYLKSKLTFATILNDGPTFNEFAVRLRKPANDVVSRMLEKGFLAGLPLASVGAGEANDLLIAVTEKRTREEMDEFARALESASCS